MKMIKNILNVLLISLVCLCAAVTHADVSVVYYHNDVLGSPVAATDENGDVLWREDYAPYGEKLGDEMEAVTEKVGYTGHRYDSDTGLTYAGARMYDPELGRFMGIDPVGALEGVSQLNNPAMFNRYAYANNNPYKYIDPDGRLPILIPVFVFVAKEVAGELFEHTTGFPAPTLKNAGKLLVKKGLKNQVKKGASPEVGGGADLKNLSPSEQKRIQNAANRSGADVTVVGSQTTGTKPSSDFDFIIEGGTSRSRSKIKNSLPQGPRGTGDGSGRDFHDGPVDKGEPHITFKPKPKPKG